MEGWSQPLPLGMRLLHESWSENGMMLDCRGQEPIWRVTSIVPQVLWGSAALITSKENCERSAVMGNSGGSSNSWDNMNTFWNGKIYLCSNDSCFLSGDNIYYSIRFHRSYLRDAHIWHSYVINHPVYLFTTGKSWDTSPKTHFKMIDGIIL